MKRPVLAVVALALVAWAAGPAWAPPPPPSPPTPFVLQLIPASGDLEGLPGSTLTYDYTVTNPNATTYYLDLTTLSWSSPPAWASFTDLFTNGPTIAPGGTATGNLVQVAILPTAIGGSTYSGTFTVYGDYWKGLPGAPGVIKSASNQPSARPFGLTVTPELSSLALLATSVPGLLAWARFRRRR